MFIGIVAAQVGKIEVDRFLGAVGFDAFDGQQIPVALAEFLA